MASLLVSCGGDSKIGRVQCMAAKAFSISAKVSSKTHPSRHLYFEPTGHDGYSETIYDSTVSSELTNTGSESIVITASWAKPAERTVTPGSSITLPPQPFKDYRIIVSTLGHDASIDFEFLLDQSVTTDGTWHLIAAWADGP